MATQYEPIVKDSTLNTTEQTSRNLADVLAEELKNIANNVKPDGSDISIDVPGMSATNVNDGFSELKGTLDSLNRVDELYNKAIYSNDIGSYITLSKKATLYKQLLITIGVSSFDGWNMTEFTINVALRPSFSGYYAFASGTNVYTVRMSVNYNDELKLNVLSSSASSLSIRQVLGLK